ncbi:hypothetical protein AFLA_003920 [Aspergillus flavus NRRL3357]|nr:hypothetical protein AFLA_003920 [Aspergillus flavus NRRL3357]
MSGGESSREKLPSVSDGFDWTKNNRIAPRYYDDITRKRLMSSRMTLIPESCRQEAPAPAAGDICMHMPKEEI